MSYNFISTYYIGIDGGGTKTEGAICNGMGEVLFSYTAPGTNPNDVGIENALATLRELIDLLLRYGDANPEEDRISLFAGISGALNYREELTAGLRAYLPQATIAVDTDAVNLLNAGVLFADGACLICGTGSSCFVRQNGELTRIGGWGYLLDNGGNGYTLGRDALEAALMAYDGRGEETCLTDLIFKWKGKQVWELISDIYTYGKPYIASFAPLVSDGVRCGDAVCKQILLRNAKEAARMLDAAYRILQKPFSVVLGGGVNRNFGLCWQEAIKQYVTAPITLKDEGMPPVFGAILQAFEIGHGLPESGCTNGIRNCFEDTYRQAY